MKPLRNLRWAALGGVLLLSSEFLLPLSSLAQNPDPIRRFQTLVDADKLYREGNVQAAENLYRQVKPDFPEPPPNSVVIRAIYDIEELDGGQRMWQNALAGLETGLSSKAFLNLQRLTANYPEFVPGHLKLAEACRESPNACAFHAEPEDPQNAIEVLERATNLYPDDPDLLRAKVIALAEAEEFLEASIAARQFSLIYLDYPEAPEFAELADRYLESYENKMRQQLLAQGITNLIIGGGAAILTGDLNQGISGIQTLLLMLKGESGFGEELAKTMVQQYKEQGQLVENPVVLNYIKGIASRFTLYMERDFEYEFYVVQDSSLNAFVLPGGKVFVNTGAILAANSEAELAGLLAHEVAHAALSHGFQGMAQSNLLANLEQVVPFFDRFSEVIDKQYSRQQERQADILGTRALAKANYAADGLRNLMVTLRQRQGDGPTTWRDSHPAPVERVRYLEDLIRSNNYNRFAYEGVKAHRDIQNRAQGLNPEPISDLPEEEQDPSQPGNAAAASPEIYSGEAAPTPPVARPVGPVALVGKARRDDVEIRIEGAEVESTGAFTVNFAIENQSDRAFSFVPSFADVIDGEGNRVSAKFAMLESDSGDSIVQPGSTGKGRVRVLGRDWETTGQQNLILVIPARGSVFRIPF